MDHPFPSCTCVRIAIACYSLSGLSSCASQVGASKEHALKGAMLSELQKRLGVEAVEAVGGEGAEIGFDASFSDTYWL